STFRVFATLPLETLHQTLSSVAIISLTLYYIGSVYVDLRASRLTWLDVLMWIFILVNFFAAYQGRVVFGQPYYFGIMAQRSVLLSISGVLLISMMNRGMIHIRQVERTFVVLSLVLLAVFYFFFLFVNPVKFLDAEFVAYSPIRGYRYRFQFALVIMLLFYSLFKISLEKRSRYYIVVLLILFYLIWYLQSRTTLAVLAITLLIFFVRNFSLREKFRNTVLYGGFALVVVAIFFSLGYTSLFDKYQVLYKNVFNVFIGESPDEASSAVRFMEMNIALDYISKNPLLGNGFISNQWNGGWHDILGYFYPVDIGLLGNIFVFGVIGTTLLYLPYAYSYTLAKQIRSNDVFFKTCEYMLLFFFLSMFFSAVNIRDSSSIMFLVCLLYYFRFYYFTANERAVVG
ncbi:MAG TPA: hypothetical protein P5292_04650, partial [Bacteroidia bacterium]|nr:hypothetical protein [Bacteroidia bacterium]